MQSLFSLCPGICSLMSFMNMSTRFPQQVVKQSCNLCAFSLQEASCAYVLIVTAVYWVSEAVPLGAAALVPAFLYPLFGVMKSMQVAAEYFKNTTLLLMGVICVAASVEKWNLHKRIALRMVMMAGAKPGMLLLCFMCCTTVLSMWLSNTSTTAMVMPIVEAVLQELVNAEEEHEVISTAGSTITEENKPIGICQYWPFFSHLCLSNILCTLFFLYSHYPKAEVVNFGTWFLFSFPISLIMLVLTWFWMHWLFLGCKGFYFFIFFFFFLFTSSYPEMVTGVFFILMTLLWFTREPGFVPGWSSFFEKKGYRTDATVSVFLGFLLFLIPAKKPCFGRREKGEEDAVRKRSGTFSNINTLDPIITWKDFQKTMPWEIVVLVGGGYALAAGCKTSGLSTWIGRQMLSFSSLPYWAVTLLACILVSLITEFVSNPATITIFLPILCSMVKTLLINPLYTLIPVTMCISFAVMLPVGNPPNAIVFSYGHCHIKDMVKAGLGVNLIGLAVVMVAINTWGTRLFQLNSFPEWAAVSNITNQT
uniref:Solute carrier family 13 member 4 n=1 Tax=Amazona collaria TaxID=241587 RepID=A0A8B9FGJ6_9PSIT